MMKRPMGAFRADQEPAVKPLHYRMSGLENVWLMNGFVEEETEYGPAVRVEDADNLHSVLAATIVADKAQMTGPEMRFIRKLMGQSQSGIARLLGCSDQRVARWEKGQTAIDPSAERLFRVIVRDWLGQDVHITAVLEALSDLDEALHSTRHLFHDRGTWKQAA
jgi:DNA-binding transcriptional regulator YiaG